MPFDQKSYRETYPYASTLGAVEPRGKGRWESTSLHGRPCVCSFRPTCTWEGPSASPLDKVSLGIITPPNHDEPTLLVRLMLGLDSRNQDLASDSTYKPAVLELQRDGIATILSLALRLSTAVRKPCITPLIS